jgi:Holliday junction DNA helicase RuvA
VHLIVREDAHILYGFATKEERTIFRQLISVSGIGPNTASLMLSAMSVNEIVGAIQTGNVDTIKRVKGIGLKTAQRVIIELKDKMGAGADVPVLVGMGVDNPAKEEAMAALLALGFVKSGAQKVLDKLCAQNPSASVEELIKQALKLL